jgi:hypothetical protein
LFKINTSDWLTRQYNLYNLYCEYNYDTNYANPNDDTRKIDQNEYIIQVLSLLVNIDGQTDEILQYFPGGVAESVTPGGVVIKGGKSNMTVINNNFIRQYNIIDILKNNN